MKSLRHYCKTFFVYTPLLARAFSGKSFFSRSVLTVKIWFFLFSRKTILKGKPKIFKCVYKKQFFTLELDSGIDIAVLIEVFVLFEYRWKLSDEPKIILDLGAHWGDTAIYYTLEYPQAVIYSVEPSPNIYQKLVKQTRQFPNIKPIQAALGSSAGLENLFISGNTLGNSLKKRSENDNVVEVQTLALEDFLKLTGVAKFDLVKFDIEGAEELFLKKASLENISNAYIGEIHLDLMELTLEDVKKAFVNFNMTCIKLNEKRYIIQADKVHL